MEENPDKIQFALFMSAIGGEAVSIYNMFTDDKSANLKASVETFQKYFTQILNIMHERLLFNKVVQREN